jgi:repressor LexA
MGRKQLLTNEQVLEAITRWITKSGTPPTVEELRRAVKVGSARTVLRYLRALEDEGAIRRWAGARGIQVLKVPQEGQATIPVPLVGEAPAGPLMIAEQNIEGWVRLSKGSIKPASAKFFLLRVRGDSMNRATVAGSRVESGDLVLVKQQSTAEPGDIVVALIDGEATIKRFAKGPGYFVLKPESTNSQHHPIVLQEEFNIQGVVAQVLKEGSAVLGLFENQA